MKILQDLPIQRKILAMALSICAAVLLLSLALLFVFQIVTFRSNFEHDTETLSAIIAKNSTAALAFEDHQTAGEILDSLKARPGVVFACLANSDGAAVASYGQMAESEARVKYPPEHQFSYLGGHLLYNLPVQLGGKDLGNLFISVDYRHDLNRLLQFYGLIMAGIVLIAFLLAAKMTAAMQQWIAEPVLMLAKTARQVGERNDYSVRSPLDGRGDELGALARAFNHMLSRIHAQDVALNLSQKKLEALVNSLDGIVWEWNPRQGRFTYVSRQCEQILGHPPEKWLADPNFWAAIVHPDDLAASMAARREATERLQAYSGEYRAIAADGRVVWIRESSVGLAEDGEPAICRGILRDITAQKNAADVLKKLNSQLVEASRKAGMAEVATGVLHNVGNVLNSVNVSASILRDQLSKSQIHRMIQATSLLRDHSADAAVFLTSDSRGRLLPGYMIKLGEHLAAEQRSWQAELDGLGRNIEHIKEIVAMQQSYAKMSGITEDLKPEDLVNDALSINEAALGRHGVKVRRDFQPVELVRVDKHKALQILINLIRNAKYAMDASDSKDKLLTMSIAPSGEDRVKIQVRDTGIGIPAANLTLIFQHGFTTKKDGHGFGLHSSGNAAREMGGSLTAHSDGTGCGAVFTIELPAAKQVNGRKPAQPAPAYASIRS